jgi:hypothetical protein
MFSEQSHNIESIGALIKSEMEKINNPIVKNAIKKIFVNPIRHLRKWDYGSGDESFVCWTIAIDKNSDTAIVYSDYGFGPETPWGLVSESGIYFGMDTGWFKDLKECFLDSKMANELPIWKVEKQINTSHRELICENMTLKKAFEKRDEVTLLTPDFKYIVLA